MSNIPRAVLNKIPGIMPLAKPENHAKDLTKLTRPELLEMKERGDNLLADKAKLRRLPDKGKRVQELHDRLLAELEQRSNVDDAAAMFSELNIANKGQATMDELEWNGHLKCDGDPSTDLLDSDDESEIDPLRIIAQRTMHERRIKVLLPETPLITAADLEQIKTFQTDSADSGVTNSLASDSRSSTPGAAEELDPHVHYLVAKTETEVSPQRTKFKPYQTTISNVHDPANERSRKQHKNWEVTAATPPLIQHSGTQLITLLDSIEMQTNYLAKVKVLQETQAAERLAARAERFEQRKIHLPPAEVLKTKAAFTVYRSKPDAVRIEGEQRFNDVDEVYDPLDEEQPGGVINYTVHGDE